MTAMAAQCVLGNGFMLRSNSMNKGKGRRILIVYLHAPMVCHMKQHAGYRTPCVQCQLISRRLPFCWQRCYIA